MQGRKTSGLVVFKFWSATNQVPPRNRLLKHRLHWHETVREWIKSVGRDVLASGSVDLSELLRSMNLGDEADEVVFPTKS